MDKNFFFKKIIELKNSLDYQENSIVSKTLINNGNNSVTVFAFDAGQEIAAHSAPVDAMVQVLDGEVEITISGEKFDLKEGDLIIMPKGEPHALLAKSKFKMMLVKI
ncbi:MAG: cupin domain-containing protein [Candidatus Gastranaerophilales bacterium]|jgi:quercetin dioxygenase-like cupin family protein|nr:cupin domain-containing protein [Candidatus Gastranaerophilales bacterium]